MDVSEASVDCFRGDDDGSWLRSYPATRPDPEEGGVLHPRMPQKFDDFVQEDGQRGHAHSVGYAQYRTHFEHRVPDNRGYGG